MGGGLDELRVSLAVCFVGDFLLNRCSTVLDDRLKHHQSIERSVRVRREHLLFDLLDRIFWAVNEMT